MRRYVLAVAGSALLLGSGTRAWADPPFFQPPHGMLVVDLDDDNMVFSNSGAAGFEDPSFSRPTKPATRS